MVAGRYELLDQVGHGAMGTVWKARDLRLDREVAAKEVCLPGPMTPQDRSVLRERSLREARVAARLTHPGVVTVHDVIEAEGSPWIIMELVPSKSLAQVLAEDGPLSPAQAAAMGMTLLEALGSAHAAGVVHRDVKPGNILVTPEGRAVLTDFGIATLHGDPRLTQAGMVMGTPGFCAPERIRGEPASPASDLWSLGATLYAAVEGRGPFEGQGSAMAILASIVHGSPPPATRAGPLETVILALMRRDPAARPDAAGARRLLTAACRGYGDATSASDGARAPASISGADVLGAGVSAAGVAGARDPDRADGGNGATADGAPDEPGIAGGTSPAGGAHPAGGTLPLPAFLARDGAAFAGQPSVAAPAPTVTTPPLPAHPSPAALVTAGAPARSGIAPASSAPLGPGSQSRRPGRHRRALLFGGRAR